MISFCGVVDCFRGVWGAYGGGGSSGAMDGEMRLWSDSIGLVEVVMGLVEVVIELVEVVIGAVEVVMGWWRLLWWWRRFL